ncbi:hypothetical protein C5167_043297 [Papaver somniferum]|uniref:J domain-containing protein n=1 Tax=Papaver somniferum TaxID=3469 RepID=A0A4Y7L695_PAPSO|nr:uncharacterized protein LOC113317868 [Papaver somniferum]RZC80716.1 hypothetical protein C5167_043297 [Papaver somniferum]
MGIFVTQEDESKSELVRRICSALTSSTVSPFRHIACIHHNHYQNIRSSFIDWYFLLRVEENAGIDKIRKQYRKLALQLHPDKNHHPNAELAFKLVSEAYICLTDKAKRTTFDFERNKRSKCEECDKARRPRSSGYLHKDAVKENTKCSREVLKETFIRESIVIQNCLRTHKATSKLGEDCPVFDPANYTFQDYPHRRTQLSHRYSVDYNLYPRKENAPMFNQTIRGIKCESPVFNWFRRRSAGTTLLV